MINVELMNIQRSLKKRESNVECLIMNYELVKPEAEV